MKLYQIRPSKDLDRNEHCAYAVAAVELIGACLRANADTSFVGVWQRGEIGMDNVPFKHAFGSARLTELPSRKDVEESLRKCFNEEVPFHMWIRSQVSCRSVFPIGDGNAYLCLGTVDPAPISKSPLINIVECSRFLVETDYLDGWVDLQ